MTPVTSPGITVRYQSGSQVELRGLEPLLLPAETPFELPVRSVSFRFNTVRYLRLRSRVLTASRRRTTGVAVEKPRQPCGLVRTEGDLLNDTDAAAVTHLGDNEVLQVNGGKVGRIEVVETY